MIRLLAIETSSEACSVALSVGGTRLEAHEHAPLRHAELLLPAVQRLLAEAGLRLGDLDAIAFGRGPGSFTSLRIGIGVVQGLAWAAGLLVVPQSSLAALALEAADLAREQGEVLGESALVRVAVDARMQEVFTAVFEVDAQGGVRPEGEEQVLPPADVAGQMETGTADPEWPWVAAGSGFARFSELQERGAQAAACYADLWPRAAMIARLAEAWLQENEPLPAALAQPVYIRDKVAEKPGGE
jgi:tRNA threonylcarbamoyladenosine biosynthesis protein TsaB